MSTVRSTGGIVLLVASVACSGGAPVGTTSMTQASSASDTLDGDTTFDDSLTSTPPTTSDPTGVDESTTAKDPSDPTHATETGDVTTGTETSGVPVESSTTDVVEDSSGGPSCGNGVIDEGENCDGDALDTEACADIGGGFTGGTLTCAADCAYDTTECETAANPTVVCRMVNLGIPDDGVVTDDLSLPAEVVGRTISDVDITVELDHTYLGDLQIAVSSGGIEVAVFDACTSVDNLDVVFDDEADDAVDCVAPDVGDVVTPLSALSGFDGDTLAATWTLEITDEAADDVGTLAQWCVTVAWE